MKIYTDIYIYMYISHYLFEICLFGVYRPTREFFTHKETSVTTQFEKLRTLKMFFKVR